MSSINLRKSLLAVLVATALTACGGGGGGGGDDGDSSGGDTPTPSTDKYVVTEATVVSELADKYDSTVNRFTCFKGQEPQKCGLIIYQVMVEAAPNGGDADGKGYGWGPSNHKGTLGGIKNSLDFIKGSGANALWITPIFTTNNSGDTAQRNTDATGYFASSHWNGSYADIDPDFGGESSFTALVDAVHDRDMKIILDGVFGHAKSDFDSTIHEIKPVNSSKCLKMDGTTEDASAGRTCFDWTRAETLKYFDELATTMVSQYKIDGWRFDQAYQVPLEKWDKIGYDLRPSFTVAEVWDGDGKYISSTVLKDNALNSAFNFPLRYKLMQTIAGQENESSYGYIRQPASGLADEWGYGNYIRYPAHAVMPTMFTDNHDLVRLGNLLFRWGFSSEANVATDKNYQLRHLLAFAFQSVYSGPITIYYGSEYGDYTKGYTTQPSGCGTGTKWCDDHVSRTQMVSGESDLASWQKTLRNNVAAIMEYRKAHPALFNGERYHIYSTKTAPSDNNAENFYVDVKKYTDDSEGEAFVYVMSISEQKRELKLNSTLKEYVCEKATGAAVCSLQLVMDTSKEKVIDGIESETLDEEFNFKMEPLSAKLYKVLY